MNFFNPPVVYSKAGVQMEWIYLKDNLCRHTPYAFSFDRMPNYIIWDRYNSFLPRHMYSHDQVFCVEGNPQKAYGMFFEGREIIPQLYDVALKNIDYLKAFDAIFTNQDILLEKLDNAYFVPGSASPWYGTNAGGGEIKENRDKTKMVSIVSSAKEMCMLHRFRKSLAISLKDKGLADCYGDFDGGNWVRCSDYLDDYRYSVIIENQCTKGYFTEKLLNCFLSLTVPIYVGSTDISDYFNIGGIIIPDKVSIQNITEIISACSEQDYLSRWEAIQDNFRRAQEYGCLEDYIYLNYKDLL